MQNHPSKLSYSPGPGELALIDRIRRRSAQIVGHGVRLGIGDDCALLQPGTGEQIAITTDLSIAGRHFRLDWHPPEVVGHRTLARGLSDLAAMGARPLAAFLSLGLPGELTTGQKLSSPWIDRFLDGFLGLAERFDTPLAGGDLAESPLAMADVVLAGTIPRGRALLRSGARAGDFVYVTGNLGGAAAGLARLRQWAHDELPTRVPTPGTWGTLRIPRKMKELLAAHLEPQPRIAQGLWLMRRRAATSAIDLSDGLSTDLNHICQESGVAAEVDASRVPVDPGTRLEQALHGGEDYELLFTASPSTNIPRAIAGVTVSRIGRVMRRRRSQPPVTLLTTEGVRSLEPMGWQHFSEIRRA